MSDSKFWITIWSIIAIVIIVTVVCITVYQCQITYTIANSSNPMVISCALGTSSSATCLNASK